MGIYCDRSALEKYKTNREFLEKFYEIVREKRPQAKVQYTAYTRQKWQDIDWQGADLKMLYPDYEQGDYVYFESLMDGLYERDMIINIRDCGDYPDVWFNGEKKKAEKNLTYPRDIGTYDVPVIFRKGQNKLTFRVKAEKDIFGVQTLPLIPALRMSPDFYVYCSWQYVDIDGCDRQKGIKISRLYKKDEPAPDIESIEWAYPVKPVQSNEKDFDFNSLCAKGCVAYAYTNVQGEITINHDSPVTVFENGNRVYSEDNGIFAKTYSTATQLLIRARKDENGWGFRAVTDGEHSIPFVTGADCPDLQWMWVGPFGSITDGKTQPYGPECDLQFDDPYGSIHGSMYWHFYRKDTMLVQSLHSNFYGQWFYAIMIGLHGLRVAANKLGREQEMIPYFSDWMKQFVRLVDYGKFERTKNGSWSRFMTPAGKIDNLDNIGTIGMNLAEYYFMTGDREAKYLLQLLADNLSYIVPRFSDRTFNRTKTMWTDDTYMCLPFFVRLGNLTGEIRYFDDILDQVRGFDKRMWMEDQELFSHIFFVNEETPNRIPWGRGNGWVALSLSEVLLYLPKDYHGYDEILGVFQKFVKGILRHRDSETKIWHQVVNNSESYTEASGSTMFITALARGVREGWIDASLKDTVTESWNALLHHCVDSDLNLHGVCMGSGCSMEEEYYMNLGTITNDDHGIGILLQACVEVMNMKGE